MDVEAAARVMVAHLFQRAGRAAMSESELANAASLDLDWFPPKEARKVVAGLVRAGYLQRTPDGDLKPVFEVRGVRVPLGFRPPKGIVSSLPPPGGMQSAVRPEATQEGRGGETGSSESEVEAAGEDPGAGVEAEEAGDAESTLDLGGLLQGLARESGEEVGVWVGRMEQVVQETGDALTPEVALLLAAAQEGLDVTAQAARLRESLEQTGA